MHFVIKEALNFPDYYGCNWSVFWDYLTDMYGEPIHIEVFVLKNIKKPQNMEFVIMENILFEFNTKIGSPTNWGTKK